jgi:membrane-bound metal-dependent hydrolase YbcI (DUF457 family)
VDNLTHSLFALTLARTPLRRAGPGTTPALLLASNAPDSDIVFAIARGSEAYLDAHRGSSHGPLGILTLALSVAALVYVVRKRGQPPTPFWNLAGVALIGTLCHVLMDLPTSYGTRLFSPFDRTWYAVDLMPIIDVYLLGLLASGLMAGRIKPSFRTHIALGVVALMGINYALRIGLHTMALGRAGGGQTAIVSAWPDAAAPKLPADYACPATPCTLEMAALPEFGSPFRWRIVRKLSNGYDIREVNLLTGRERPMASVASDSARVVDHARQTSASQSLLRFSRFPAARVETQANETIVRLLDVRFLDSPAQEGDEEFRRGRLFAVRIRLDSRGGILEERFGN